jgi:cellulose synthase/poly-beta-1,6-N-acetylglucosamine synthase-like glycosyltransferase
VKLTVLVPTYRRPADLSRCLRALEAQTRPPDQVVVIAREDDHDTRSLLAARQPDPLPLQVLPTELRGQVAALNAGLRAAAGDVIAILDDDTAPWPDWLDRIESHFTGNPRLGGLGGRDMIRAEWFDVVEDTSKVGRISWYGRWVGQAHRGTGPAREVDLLKGCNMSFRREASRGLWFDRRLKGDGAQWFNDAAFCLAVKRAGWQVVYDPAVRVDHYLGERPAGDGRESETPADVYGVVYNETLILLEYFSPARRVALLGFGLTVGTRRAPGLLQWLRSALVGRRSDREYYTAALRARLDAWRDFRRGPIDLARAPDGQEAMSL